MPYGSNGVIASAPSQKHWIRGRPSGDVLVNTTYGTNWYEKQFYHRTGTNSPGAQPPFCKRYPGPMKLVSVELPLGKRLPYKVFSKRQNRMVWARKPLKVWKLVRDRSQVAYKKGLDLPPNRLHFHSIFHKKGPDNANVCSAYVDDYFGSFYVEGDLWDRTSWFGNGTLPATVDTVAVSQDDYIDAVERCDKQALTRLYSKVKDQHVNLLNAMGERAQTIKMLTSMIGSLGKALIHFKKGRLDLAARDLLPGASHKDFANAWLLFVYGIKPLISDIEGLIDHLNEYPPLEFDVNVSASEVVDLTTPPANFVAGPKLKYWTTGKCTVNVKYKVRIKVKDNYFRNFAKLGLANLNATAWELIPFSFLVDWIIPIGEYLNTGDAFLGCETVFCSKTVFLSEEKVFNREFGGFDMNGYWWTQARTSMISLKVTVDRFPLTAVPRLEFPDFKNPFSRAHTYNLLALFSQLSRKNP